MYIFRELFYIIFFIMAMMGNFLENRRDLMVIIVDDDGWMFLIVVGISSILSIFLVHLVRINVDASKGVSN